MGGLARARPLFRFRLFGIPVHVRAYFLVLLAVGAMYAGSAAAAVIWIAAAGASVLWHELGHALTMRAFGFPPWIELHAFGGFAHWPEAADPSAREELLVVAAGPGAGLLLGAAVWLAALLAPPPPGPWAILVRDLLWVNVAWSLFNLFPLLPLDGALLLDAATRLVNGIRRPRWVGWASLLAGAAVVAWGVLLQSMYLAFLGGVAAVLGWQRAGVKRLFAGRGAPPPTTVEQARRKAGHARARGDLAGVAAALLPEARVGALPERDLAELVGALLRLGRDAELVALCRDRLGGFARRADAEPLARLAAEAFADDGAHEEAALVARLAFQQLRIPYQAYDAACHLVQLGRAEEAVEWLERALEAGLDCEDALRTDPALDPLRDRDDFQALAARAEGEPEGEPV